MEWLIWVGGALLLIVIETVTADLTFLMIAGGALGGRADILPRWACVGAGTGLRLRLHPAALRRAPWAKRRLGSRHPHR